MFNTSSPTPNLQDPIVKWLLGFFGAVLGFLLLPKTVKFVLRKFLLGTLTEIVTIVLTGLLTEKAVDLIGKENDRR
jgi:hypothetical protein